MKSLLLVIFLLGSLPIYSQVNSLKGNVFWKYNKYVGNRADAGSEIFLHPLFKRSEPFITVADLAGNFSIDQIPSGRYLLIVKSKNTKDDPFYYSAKWRIYKKRIDTAFAIDVSTLRPDLQKSIDSLYDVHNEFVMNSEKIKPKQYFKEISKQTEAMLDLQNQLIKQLPDDIKLQLMLFYGIHNSLDFRVVEFNGSSLETIVVDFGITYM